MRVNAEKMALLFVIASLVLTSMVALVWGRTPLTREEAIEISKNSRLVQGFLENADYYTLEIHYENKTQSDRGHGVWYIWWYIHPVTAPSAARIGVNHSIDEETGEIFSEEFGGILR